MLHSGGGNLRLPTEWSLSPSLVMGGKCGHPEKDQHREGEPRVTTYLTTNEAAERLRVAPQTLRLWRYQGTGPRYVKPSRVRCLYAEADLEAFMRERTFSSTAEETVSREISAAGA